jgi:uncharacterized protein YggT (Ycf19 family)
MGTLAKLVTMSRLLAFMVLLYVGLAWMVERRSQNPESKVRAFFRILCSPVTGPVGRFLPAGSPHQRVLAVSAGVVAAAWVVLIALDELLRRAP